MNDFVSIIIPVFNEETNIASECNIIKQSMDKSNYPYEIIVVNDGSTDNSAGILNSLPFIRLICLKNRKGNGYARRIGTMNALGNIIVWTDCDLSYPNYIIPKMIAEMKDKNYEQIVGLRRNETGPYKHLRFIAKWIIKKIASVLTAVDIPDLNSGLRIFKKNVGVKYLHLLPNGFSCMATMTLAFICNGNSIGYFPIIYSLRKGATKFHFFWDTIKYFIQVIKIILHCRL